MDRTVQIAGGAAGFVNETRVLLVLPTENAHDGAENGSERLEEGDGGGGGGDGGGDDGGGGGDGGSEITTRRPMIARSKARALRVLGLRHLLEALGERPSELSALEAKEERDAIMSGRSGSERAQVLAHAAIFDFFPSAINQWPRSPPNERHPRPQPRPQPIPDAAPPLPMMVCTPALGRWAS